jgi:hypothetical protein
VSEEPLSEELRRLERTLAGRSLPVPLPHLRSLALAGVRRERARERRLKLAAALALLAVVLARLAPVSGVSQMIPPPPAAPESVQRERLALASLGLDATDAGMVALELRACAIPHLAPPIGSSSTPRTKLEGP